MLGLHYGSDRARQLAATTMATICHSAYRASIELATEKGSFPFFDADHFLQRPFVQSLPRDIQEGIAAHGQRNSHLTAIAPTGTISLLANNVSSGIEPVFNFEYRRRVRGADGSMAWYALTDQALRLWRSQFADRALHDAFVDAHHLTPEQHLAMQAAVQPFVDNAISKTINIPADYDFGSFRAVYVEAYRLGLKGCTTFRPNPVTGSVLERDESDVSGASHCCDVDREGG